MILSVNLLYTKRSRFWCRFVPVLLMLLWFNASAPHEEFLLIEHTSSSRKHWYLFKYFLYISNATFQRQITNAVLMGHFPENWSEENKDFYLNPVNLNWKITGKLKLKFKYVYYFLYELIRTNNFFSYSFFSVRPSI